LEETNQAKKGRKTLKHNGLTIILTIRMTRKILIVANKKQNKPIFQ
jgi:ATP phosphoribosyltransferase